LKGSAKAVYQKRVVPIKKNRQLYLIHAVSFNERSCCRVNWRVVELNGIDAMHKVGIIYGRCVRTISLLLICYQLLVVVAAVGKQKLRFDSLHGLAHGRIRCFSQLFASLLEHATQRLYLGRDEFEIFKQIQIILFYLQRTVAAVGVGIVI
jgi:hypothetical protein